VNDPPNEPGIEKEPPIAPVTEEPAAASRAEPPAEPPFEPCEDSLVRKKTPVREQDHQKRKQNHQQRRHQGLNHPEGQQDHQRQTHH